MHYFEARSHEKFLSRFRRGVDLYWLRDPKAPSDRALRGDFREAIDRVRALGYEPSWVATAKLVRNPQALVGNYVGDVLSAEGWRREKALSFFDECIGAAKLARRTARNRLLSPWCWPVDLVAVVISFPVRALRAAGMPKAKEDEAWVKTIQVAFNLLVLVIGAILGLKVALD